MFLSFDSSSKEIKISSIKNKYKIINNIKSYGVNLDKKKNIYLLNFKNNQIVKLNNNLKKIKIFTSDNKNIFEQNLISKIFKKKYKNQIIDRPHSIGFLNEKIYLINLGDRKNYGNITILNNELKKIKIIKNYFGKRFFKKPAMIFIDKNKKIFISDTKENEILIFDKDFNLLNWIGSKNKKINEDFKKKNLINIDLNNPHGVNNFKEFLVICDSHNNRIIFIKNNKIYGWFENTANNQIAFYFYDKKKYKYFQNIKNLNGPLDIAVFKDNIILTESYTSDRLLKINIDKIDISEVKIVFKKNKKLRNPYEIKIIDNYIYVADPGSENIKIFPSEILSR